MKTVYVDIFTIYFIDVPAPTHCIQYFTVNN